MEEILFLSLLFVSFYEKLCLPPGLFRATKIQQRMYFAELYAGRAVVVSPGGLYYLVPSLWLNRWRSYLGASGKNLLAVDEPDGLEGLIFSLLCSKVLALSLDKIIRGVFTLLSSLKCGSQPGALFEMSHLSLEMK